jgi:hypothetical protein
VTARAAALPGPSRAILGLFVWRLLLLLLPALFAAQHLAPFAIANYRANFHGAGGESPGLSIRWATWDAQHYLSIARDGYVAGEVSSAFWPLWPGVIRGVSKVTGAPELPAALVAANLLAIAAAVGLWQLACHRASGDEAEARRIATWTVVLLLAFPSAFFLGLPYSEALFLALSVGLFLALDRDRYAWAALAAFALPLTRPVGLFILLPLACHVLQERRRAARAAGNGPTWRRSATLLLAPIAGTAAYFLVHLLATGEVFGAFGVRGVFASGQSLGRLLDLPGFLRSAITVDAVHSVTGSAIDRLLFALVIAALPWLYRRDRVLFWYVVPMALVPAVSLRFMAFNRFALVLFPLFWAGASGLAARERPALRWTVLGLSLALQLGLYFRHSLNLWAG